MMNAGHTEMENIHKPKVMDDEKAVAYYMTVVARLKNIEDTVCCENTHLEVEEVSECVEEVMEVADVVFNEVVEGAPSIPNSMFDIEEAISIEAKVSDIPKTVIRERFENKIAEEQDASIRDVWLQMRADLRKDIREKGCQEAFGNRRRTTPSDWL